MKNTSRVVGRQKMRRRGAMGIMGVLGVPGIITEKISCFQGFP
jgi:hypothetical protein